MRRTGEEGNGQTDSRSGGQTDSRRGDRQTAEGRTDRGRGDGQPRAPAALTALANAAGPQHGQADLGTGGPQGALGDGRQQEGLGHARQAHGRGGPAAGGFCSGWARLSSRSARLSSCSAQAQLGRQRSARAAAGGF